MYLTDQLDLNFLEGMVLESVIKPKHTCGSFRQALRDLEELISGPVISLAGRATMGLDNFFRGSPERGYNVGRVVTTIARARYRSTRERTIQNYKMAYVMIRQMLETLEVVEGALATDVGDESDEDTMFE